MKTEKLRAFLLEKGDEFIMGSCKYKVSNVSKVFITYHSIYSNYIKHKFGAKSRQRIDLICKPMPAGKLVFVYGTDNNNREETACAS